MRVNYEIREGPFLRSAAVNFAASFKRIGHINYSFLVRITY